MKGKISIWIFIISVISDLVLMAISNNDYNDYELSSSVVFFIWVILSLLASLLSFMYIYYRTDILGNR